MRKNLMKGVALLGAAILVAGCSHDAWNQTYDGTQQFAAEYSSNFKTLVLNGQNVDPNQMWNTAVTTKVNVSVVKAGTLKIYSANPFGNTVAPLYESPVEAGQQVVATIARPQDATTLYATIVDAEGYITMELVGRIKCEGLTLVGLQEKIAAAYKEYLLEPHVTATFIYQAGQNMVSPWGTVTVL